MTLILTELTSAGIVMAADSSIAKVKNGKIIEVDKKGWKKILRVPKITAGLGYWGLIGAVTPKRFDRWLTEIIEKEEYNDLPSFASLLAERMNKQCNGKPLPNGKEVGVHVAGFSEWPDGKIRPAMYHVHNGHATMRINERLDRNGNLIEVETLWETDPRKLFEAHLDLPDPDDSLEDNLAKLNDGSIWRNGDYFLYAILSRGLEHALGYVSFVKGLQILKDPDKVAARMGFLRTIVEIMVKLYRHSNHSRMIGGEVSCLGIKSPGRFVQ